MKILYYNWVQFDDYKLRGGGVSVYLKAIINELKSTDDIYFLSCGQHYDLFKRKIRVVKTINCFSPQVHSYCIYNSPIKAPAHDAFCSIEECRASPKLKSVFKKFIIDKGPFDIIHFNNLEGLTMDIFDLKDDFPRTKFIFTAHNYHLICPQIELFRDRTIICEDNLCGYHCVNCIGHRDDMQELIRYQRLGSFIETHGFEGQRIGNFIFDFLNEYHQLTECIHKMSYHIKRVLFGDDKVRGKDWDSKKRDKVIRHSSVAYAKDLNVIPATGYYFWRIDNIKLFNSKIDKIICVSNQVKDTLIKYGIESTKTETVWNGCSFHTTKKQAQELWMCKKNCALTIGYFGYPIPSKGLSFLLDALELVDEDLTINVNLLIASRTTAEIRSKVDLLTTKFKNIRIIEGYEQKDISSLMTSISLAVIPSLWKETYCQTVAELICHGVPTIISNTVGIKDLYKSEEYIFDNSDPKNLTELLNKYLKNPEQLDDFWNQIEMPWSINEHINKLKVIYRE